MGIIIVTTNQILHIMKGITTWSKSLFDEDD
jgi:hypothetical protein